MGEKQMSSWMMAQAPGNPVAFAIQKATLQINISTTRYLDGFQQIYENERKGWPYVQSIAPNQNRRCTLCDRPATDPHHVLHRGRGGEDVPHNVMYICRADHDAHHAGLFTIDQEAHAQGWLKVYTSTKVLAYRRLSQRERIAGDESANDSLSYAIQRIEDAAEFGLNGLSLEELAHVSESVNSLTHAWPLRAEAIKRAYDGWLLWGEDGLETRKTYKLNAIAKRFQVHPGTARQEYDIASTFAPEDGDFAAYASQGPVKDFS